MSDCTCETMVKNGTVFICLRDPGCPEHGDPDTVQSRSAKRIQRCDAAKREARRDALEEACKLMCPECRDGQEARRIEADRAKTKNVSGWEHPIDHYWGENTWNGVCVCPASAIRDLMEQDK